MVVVPAPPLAPKKTNVVDDGFEPWTVSRRAVRRRTAPWNSSSAGGHVKNSLAPARIAWRMRSGSAADAMAKMPVAGALALMRSMFAIADDTSVRMSTTTRSAGDPSRTSSMTLTGMGPDCSSRPVRRLNSSSFEQICAAS